MFLHRNFPKYNWTSPDGKKHVSIDSILIDRRWRSGILHVKSLRWADCDTDHNLLDAKVDEILAVINKQNRIWIWKDFSSISLFANP
jgi:hypothetical protein